MEISRNQWYLAGLVLLFLGIQFRTIESVQFTPEFTQFLAERTGHPMAAVGVGAQTLLQADRPVVRTNYRPPEFLGWMLASLGAVMVLHSWAMPKPSG